MHDKMQPSFCNQAFLDTFFMYICFNKLFVYFIVVFTFIAA